MGSLTGAFLPLREIRKCVPEFSALNMIFLYLTDYTEEKESKNSYRWRQGRAVQFQYRHFLQCCRDRE